MFYNLPVSRFGYRQTEMKHNKFKTNKLTQQLARTKAKSTTRVRVLQLARFGYTGQTGMKHTTCANLQKRVSCGMVLMASTMLHEKCCNTVLQIGAPLIWGLDTCCKWVDRLNVACIVTWTTTPAVATAFTSLPEAPHEAPGHYRLLNLR